jgi:vesicle-fusing ATPase
MLAVGLNLKPTNLPEKDLAFTNKAYVSQSDLVQLCTSIPKNGLFYVEVKGCIFSLEAHKNMEVGTIALNKVQREYAKIGLSQDVFAKQYVPAPNAELGTCKCEVDFYMKPASDQSVLEIKEEEIEAIFRQRFTSQVVAVGQPIPLDYNGQLVKFVIQGLMPPDFGDGNAPTKVSSGILASHTEIDFQQGSSGKLRVLSNKVQQRSIFRPDFNFEELGIGGLKKEFGDIFRRAFAARVFPPHVVRDLGINHVRGMLLHGPPGTGKTLIARKLAKFLKAAEPKIVNGPEILNKYVGQAEENIRNLFADAEKEYKLQGENSQLHVVIFDEIDSICKSRGSNRDGTGVHDSIVNQLLSKIDGVDSLNNILLIGMTNRMDLIDEALLRPGRLEVHVEISLPDESGRVEILNIHSKSMREKGYLDPGVSIEDIAAQTKNFSGAELEGLIRSATSFALNRKVNVNDLAKSKDMGNISVTRQDFDLALSEIKPAFGQHENEFEFCIGNGITEYSTEFDHMLRSCLSLLNQLRNSHKTPLLTLLVHGPAGCGKTALAAHLAQKSDYPFVRRISSENYVGYSEQAKISAITKVFEDAYKSDLSVIVLDDLERLMDYVRIGPRFSNSVLQALFSLLKKVPPKANRKLLVIATTSDLSFLEETELLRAFTVAHPMPVLTKAEHFKAVLQAMPGFLPPVVDEISAALNGKRIGIRTIYVVAEMAAQQQTPVKKEVFLDCLLQCSTSM